MALEDKAGKLRAADSAEPLVEMSVKTLSGGTTEPIVIDLEQPAPRKTSSNIKRRGSNARRASVDAKRATTKEEQADREAVKAILEKAQKERNNREHSWVSRTLFWRPSVIFLPPLPFVLVALAVFIADACVFIWSRDTVVGSEGSEVPTWRVLLFVFVMIAMIPVCALLTGLLVRFISALYGARAFYFTSPLALWTLIFRISYRFVLNEPWDAAWWWIKFLSSVMYDPPPNFVMAIVTCFLLVLEKSIIISLNRSSLWEKIRSNIFAEAVLQRLYTKMRKGKAPSRKLYKQPSSGGFIGLRIWESKPDFYTFTRIQEIVSKNEYVSLTHAEKEEEEISSKAEAKELAEKIYDWMDSDKRGWLDITDFYNIFPESEVSDAFALFDHSTGKVTKDDMVSGVQNIYRGRKNLARAVRDRDNIAGILSRVFLAVFWLISVVVVLILLNVPAAAFLPFATFVLSFSFAFGSTLKNLLESLIMIFIEKPFDAGDRILVGSDLFIVHKMHLLTTEAHTPDGRKWYIPNSILSQMRIANYHRSKPYTSLLAIELPYSASAGQMHQLTVAVREYCLKETSSFEEPSIFLNSVVELNKITLNMWLPLKAPWIDMGRVNNIMTELQYFIHGKVRELNIEYVRVLQPVEVHKSDKLPKVVDMARPMNVKFADQLDESRK